MRWAMGKEFSLLKSRCLMLPSRVGMSIPQPFPAPAGRVAGIQHLDIPVRVWPASWSHLFGEQPLFRLSCR